MSSNYEQLPEQLTIESMMGFCKSLRETLSIQREIISSQRDELTRHRSWFARDSALRRSGRLSSVAESRSRRQNREWIAPFLQAIIDSNASCLAILDESGIIRHVNRLWQQSENLNGAQKDTATVGSSYLEFCEASIVPADDTALVCKGIQDILEGNIKEFHKTTSFAGIAGPRYIRLSVIRLEMPTAQGSFPILVTHEDVTPRKQNVKLFEDSQRQLRDVLNNVFGFVAILAADGTVMEVNRTALEMAAATLADVTGKKFWACPWWSRNTQVQKQIQVACEKAAAGESVRYNLCIRTVAARAMSIDFILAPLKNEQGRITHLIASAVDVTERKKMEDAYRELSGRLICIQDAERRRIARELHDDLNQRVALLAIELQQLDKGISKRFGTLHRRIQGLWSKAQEISTEMHRLSCQLHPANLDHVGLVAAVQAFCSELAEHHSIKIDFRHRDLPCDLHKEVRLCLFRVIQEGLHNVVKHSGAPAVAVVLERIDDSIHLSISDDGSGFDVEAALLKGGLGLISMSERLRLVGGEISIKSQPSEGTLISVFVPLNGRSLCEQYIEGATNEKVLPFPVQNVCEVNRVLT